MTSATGKPLVSVCMPVFNGADLVGRAVQSALEQDYPNLEIVVVDDASTDETVEVLRGRFGDRIRLFVNPAQTGLSRNTNASVAHSQGSLIKFLHHDDLLERDCVLKMADAMAARPSIGMVFSRRRVEADADSPASRAWLQRYGEVHRGFRSLQAVNRGQKLLDELVASGLHHNWVGEPSCVMVKRECLERLGGFHLHVRQAVDLELWLRIMAHYDVAFIDEELATYRRSGDSSTTRVRTGRRDWLDRLWMLETLMSNRDVHRRFPEVERMWRAERRMAFRTVVRAVLRPRPDDPPIALWRPYVGYRARGLLNGAGRATQR